MFKFSIQIKWTIVIIIYHVNEKVDLWNPRWVEVGLSGKHYLALHLQGKNLKEKEHEKKRKTRCVFQWIVSLLFWYPKKKQRKSVDVKKSFSLNFWSFLVSSFGWNKILLFSTLSGHIIKCLLTAFEQAGQKNIWLSFSSHRPCCTLCIGYVLKPNIFLELSISIKVLLEWRRVTFIPSTKNFCKTVP